MDRYEFVRELGHGKFGVVSQYYDTESHRNVAVKAIRISCKDEGFPSSILRDVSILKELNNHDNIVKLVDVVADDMIVYLIFEFLDGTLSSFFDTHVLSQSQIKMIMHGLLSGLSYLHNSEVVHRDLCPTNVLVKTNDEELIVAVKVADFGLARYVSPDQEGYTHTECTYEYTAPEQLLKAHYSTPVDIWAAGCMFAEMVRHGEHIFRCNRELTSIAHISDVLGRPSEDIWPGLTKLAPAFRTFQYEAPKALEEHLDGLDLDGVDLVKRMLVWDPNKRITALDALRHPYFKDL